MLKEYAREFLMVGHELSTASHKLFETELLDQTFSNVGTMHDRHREAMAALKRAEFGSLMLPLGTLSKEIDRVIREHESGSVVDRLKVALDTIRFRFDVELQGRQFLYVPAEYSSFYQQKEAFGAKVQAVFSEASEDIENAGNCLALQQGTACVFHLMRAMEVVVNRLASRFSLPKDYDVTWLVLTGNMTDKINTWPKKKPAEKRKRERWSGAVSYLHHVGRATRNPTMHPKKTYTQQQARQVYDAVRLLMTEVAEILSPAKKGQRS